jgi:very-short-patch-repair endonuclease
MKASPQTARRLRREQTDAERALWFRLRDRRLNGWKFRRQFPIDRYIVDFFCADAHLIIELDGGQHAVRTATDAQRTKVLEAMGYLVLRFWNSDVMQNLDGVLEEIIAVLESPGSDSPQPCVVNEGARENAAHRGTSITSPRRGEIERPPTCLAGARVRRFGRRSSSPTSEPPHPNPLPSGERESR